jgi:hypothetical protein
VLCDRLGSIALCSAATCLVLLPAAADGAAGCAAQGHVEWEAFVAEGTGVLWQLATEQEGELVGPKPSRRDMYASSGDENSELLAMMQGVGLG